MMEEELKILRQIKNLLQKSKDQLLMEIVPADCKCQGKTKKVFRCPEAFEINLLMNNLDKL